MGNIKWRYNIVPLADAKAIIDKNTDCYINVSLGSSPGYHIQSGRSVLCRISKSSFNVLNDGETEDQPPFINQANYKIKKLPNEPLVQECDATKMP